MKKIILEDWDESKGELLEEMKFGTRMIIDGKVILEDITTVNVIEALIKYFGLEYELELKETEEEKDE